VTGRSRLEKVRVSGRTCQRSALTN